MARFSISKLLPFVSGEGDVVAEKSRYPAWFIEWQGMPIPRTKDSAENWRLASWFLPKYSLSGPLPYNARPIRICNPAPAQAERRFPSGTIGGAGLLNGQVMSQPLWDNDAGGFTQQLQARFSPPFGGLFADGIAPAGNVA